MPAVAGTVSAPVSDSTWIAIGEMLFVEGAGYLVVTSIPDTTHVVLRNDNTTGNAAPATVIPGGSKVGAGGVQGVQGTPGFAVGATYYFHAAGSGIVGYELVDSTPPIEGEVDESAIAVGGGGGTWGVPVLIDSYATAIGEPGMPLLPAGEWTFHFWAYVSSLAGDSRLVYEVYKRAAGGAETLLFTFNSSLITSSSGAAPAEIIDSFVTIVNTPLDPTDRIVFKNYAQTDSNSNRTIHYFHSGSLHSSHVESPVPVHGGNAFTNTKSDFVMPAVSGTVSVPVYDTAWMVVGQTLFVETAGYMVVISTTDTTHVVLRNDGAAGNAAPTTVIPNGSDISAGGAQGINGVSSYTITTAGFTMPAIGATVVVSVLDTSWIGLNQKLFVETAGYMTATAIGGSTSVTLMNSGETGNAAGGAGILTSKKVSPGGVEGIGGAPGLVLQYAATTTSSTFVSVGSIQFDASRFPGKTFNFEVTLQVSRSARIGYARLWNVTDATAVSTLDNSLAGDRTLATTFTSGSLALPASTKVYEAHIRIDVLGPDVVVCKHAQINIV